MICAVVLGASGCSSSDDTAPPTSDSPTTEAPTTEAPTADPVDTAPDTAQPSGADDPLDVEFSSEPIDVGPLFGDAAASPAADDAAEEVVTDDPDSTPDDPDSTPNDPPVETTVAFTPAVEDAPFCTLLDDMNGRPFPSDDFEALIVANVWIGELRKIAVEEITDDLDVLLDFLAEALAANGDIDISDSSDAIDAASDRVSDYVDERCLGREPAGATTEE